MEKWVLVRKGGNFTAASEKFHISPRTAALIRNRDIVGEANIYRYLEGSLSDLEDGFLMKDMDKAVAIIQEKIADKSKIRVIGDYDIDGVNATYIILRALQMLGAAADSDIPDRIRDGYGLNEELIERAYRDGIDTIITCDNGIAAKEAIAYGKNLGLTIIVTDHHEVPYQAFGGQKKEMLPSADAVVNPHQSQCPYPFKGLCGAAVAYKVMECLFESLGHGGEDLDELLENVAIATVGDVMELKEENRILVKEGLNRLRKTSNVGISALLEATNVDKEKVSAYHIGFILGPCINAGGRLDTAKRSLALLLATDPREAKILAAELKALNDSRKEMTAKAVSEAQTYITQNHLMTDDVIVVYLPNCHESIAGIVAGRIKELYYRPTIVLTNGKEGVKGSGRSIEGYSLYDGLHECQELLEGFGGHKMAAGLSLKEENIESLREGLNRRCKVGAEEHVKKIKIDMELPFLAINKKFIEELSVLEPFGVGNTKPVFVVRDVEVRNAKLLGKNNDILKMQLRDATGTELAGICFKEGASLLAASKQRMNLLFYPQVNEYMGKQSVQLVITGYKIAE